MGELARQRRARDLWISRGHLWALSAGVVLLALCAFFLGTSLARTGPAAASAPAPGSGLDAPEESLVDLLARVDARAVSQDGVDTLTFPDTLTGVAEDPAVPAPPVDEGGATSVAPGEVGQRPMDLVMGVEDATEAEILVHALTAEGFRARIVAESGSDAFEVVVEGGDDVDAARQVRGALLDVLTALDRTEPVSMRARPQ